MTFLTKLHSYTQKGWISEKYRELLEQFYLSYKAALSEHQLDIEKYAPYFDTFLDHVKEQIARPFVFEPYHERIRFPFDYYRFGLDFLKPLVDMAHSTVVGTEHLKQITSYLKQGENAIFFSNHQTEADPQAISILLEKDFPKLGEEMIFVAGERVLTDSMAIPFSMGRNLLCIYSKRYIDHPPELKEKKQLHNKKTMEKMSALLSEGGKAIYVAPSGGRDRPKDDGEIVVAPFDPSSIEMFYLMAKKAKKTTHFFTLALATYGLLPPPDQIRKELGETRRTSRGALHLACGKEINMQHFPGSDTQDKHEHRQARAHAIWQQVERDYEALI